MKLGKYNELRKNVDAGTANARVTAARYTPRIRNAGRPMRRAATTPTSIEAARQTSRLAW